jgi:bacillopeptidase F
LVRLPSTYATATVGATVTATSAEIVLTEQGEGHYVGTWTAPKEKFNGAVIEVVLRDDYGNESRQTAAGKVYVNVRPN